MSDVSPRPTSEPCAPLDLFVQSLERRKVSARSVRAYRHDTAGFLEYLRPVGEAAVAIVQPKNIEAYLATLARAGAKLSTLRRTLSAIREFYGFLVGRKIMAENPAMSVRIAPIPGDIFSPGEIGSIFEYLSRRRTSNNEAVSLRYLRDETILVFMIFHGVRQYQSPLLKLSGIRSHTGHLELRIGDRVSLTLLRHVLVKLQEYLRARNSSSDTMFTEPLDGTAISVECIRSLFQELNYALNRRCSAATIYHTYLHLESDPDAKRDLLVRIVRSIPDRLSRPSLVGDPVRA